ncbi:MAG: cytochrome D1 domain-containing protein [Gammaproteobacteria bacterium]|nr:cytochrome D1 domain-containing protein [Gammaproteobacteria bacterium]
MKTLKLLPIILALSACQSTSVKSMQGETAYAINEKDATISLVDTATDKVIGKLPASGRLGAEINATVIDSSGQYLYVVDADDAELIKVDLTTRNIVEKVEVGEGTEGLDISPDGKTLVVL